MSKATDIRTAGAALFFLPVQTRVPLKFGSETLTHITCARARVTVADRAGRTAEGWGETPLSVQWVWPSPSSVAPVTGPQPSAGDGLAIPRVASGPALRRVDSTPYEERHEALKQFCVELTELWASVTAWGHPIELGHDFLETVLPGVLKGFNQRKRRGREPMPWLAALVCCSPFDIAVHDAYGKLHGRPAYQTYNAEFMNRDLASFLQPATDADVSFGGKYPADFLSANPAGRLVAWHLVGGLDALDSSELTGAEPKDGYPVTLVEWIERDGLTCLKVKLRGNDADWDFQRLAKVASIGGARGVNWLSADFNCTVQDPEYVNAILDRLRDEHPRAFAMILYVEQPFPYELEQHALDVRSVASRKPLFLDESAHDWKLVRLGRELGWTGVALKTCKTQTGALLTACWARAHGMSLMVQDLTNPMLAQIPHALLAAHAGTIMGVETNAMQFYPDASLAEERVHPGLYRRRGGAVDLNSVRGEGFGYRLAEISRALPEAAAVCSS